MPASSRPRPHPALLWLFGIIALMAALATPPARAALAPLDELIQLHRNEAAPTPLSLLADPAPGRSVHVPGTPAPHPAPPAALLRVAGPAATDPVACPALLRHEFVPITGGSQQSLCQHQGKVVLVVNTASKCGYTHQYEGLEALYRKYGQRGLVVIGFPSNDFGGQEPGSNREIAEFCRTVYGVQFPMYEKQSGSRLAANPLYAELVAKTGQAPRWNFHKYVIDRSGTRVASFASDVEPGNRDLVALIERLLAERPPAART